MTLAEYPELIARAHFELLKTEQAARDFQAALDQVVAKIKLEIAFDPGLKNEQQREARKLELMQGSEVGAIVSSLNACKDEQARKAIELELLRNQFAVAKIAERRAIAQLELEKS